MNRYRIYRGNTTGDLHITMNATSIAHAYYLFCEFMSHALMGEAVRHMKDFHGLDAIEADQAGNIFSKFMSQELSYGAYVEDLGSNIILDVQYDSKKDFGEWLSGIVVEPATVE